MRRFINLVPEAHKRRVIIRRLLRDWAAIIAFSSVALLAYFLYERDVIQDETERRVQIESKARPYVEMAEATEKMRREIASIEQNDAILRRLSNEGSPILPIALVSRGVGDCTGRIWVQQLSFHSKAPDESDAKGTKGKEPIAAQVRSYLVIKGLAIDNMAVSDFVRALRKTKGFRGIELKSAVSVIQDGAMAMTFEIESEL